MRETMTRLDLQLFADGQPAGDAGQQTPSAGTGAPTGQQQAQAGQGGPQVELPKTVEELQRLIQSESDRRVTQALQTAQTKWQAEMEARVKAAAEEAAKLAKMSAEEREKALAAKAQEELRQREAALAARELELKATDMLIAKQLPLEFKPFILDADETKTALRIDQFAALFQQAVQAAVEERLKGAGKTPAPPAPNSGQVNPWLKDSFNLTEQARLLRENPALAATLKAQAGVR